ncbi:hypothetical protein BaRGS_00018801 [Batillaria attramentaria]|uniref:Fibrinogen C-terminal domain-containing protein n=1 Tax=Batillaria attramentaria TaxID=370345 RepID=A0ABD0KSC6_9CAEN
MNFTTELFCVAVLLSLFVASAHNRDCYAVTKSGVFMWLDKNGHPDVAYCDHDTDGGDAMRVRNNNQQFSTWDENRSGNRLNCALNNNHGAWWYSAVCTDANLNGRYKAGGKPVLRTLDWDGIVWWAWHRDWRSLKHVEMKIRTQA